MVDKEKCLKEASEQKAETERALAVAFAKLAHKSIEDIERERKKFPAFSE